MIRWKVGRKIFWCSIPEFVRLVVNSDCFELDLVDRKATSDPAMKLDIRHHLDGLSLSDTSLIP